MSMAIPAIPFSQIRVGFLVKNKKPKSNQAGLISQHKTIYLTIPFANIGDGSSTIH